MLEMREKEALPLQVPGELFPRKQRLVELAEVGSAGRRNAMRFIYKSEKEKNLFVLEGKLNDRFCCCKLGLRCQ